MNAHDYDKLTIDTVKKVAPCVVSIVISKYLPRVKTMDPMSFFNPFLFEDVEDGAKQKVQIGGGSGFIVHADGLVLTNKHVVFDEDAEYTVLINNGTEEHPAKVLTRDPINDIAILKIEGKHFPTVPLGNSSKLALGQTVVAIGNALGMFSNSVSKGIISGLSRSISASLGGGDHMERLRGVLQTDVAINQGNSGGPLINLDGEAVAINTAVIFGAQNIGFSIPINWAKTDLEDLIKHGRIIKPYIGLMYLPLNKEFQKKYGLPVSFGAMVIRDHRPDAVAVMPNSPADKAGIKENDIITHVDGTEITEQDDLMDLLQKFAVGKTIELTLYRKDKEHKVKITLEERK